MPDADGAYRGMRANNEQTRMINLGRPVILRSARERSQFRPCRLEPAARRRVAAVEGTRGHGTVVICRCECGQSGLIYIDDPLY